MLQESCVTVDGYEVKLTNLNKLIWPEGLTKAHLVKYYREIAPYILPHLYNRPLVMKRYPDGLDGEPFYQKECPSYAPDWIITHPVEHSEKIVNYIICNNIATLVWLANQGTIEMHPWLSRIENVECPDIAVIDLDPAEGTNFIDVLKIALLVKEALSQFNLLPRLPGVNRSTRPVTTIFSRLRASNTATLTSIIDHPRKFLPLSLFLNPLLFGVNIRCSCLLGKFSFGLASITL